MGHSFGLIDIALPGRSQASQSRGSLVSIRRFSIMALGLAIALISLSQEQRRRPNPPRPVENPTSNS